MLPRREECGAELAHRGQQTAQVRRRLLVIAMQMWGVCSCHTVQPVVTDTRECHLPCEENHKNHGPREKQTKEQGARLGGHWGAELSGGPVGSGFRPPQVKGASREADPTGLEQGLCQGPFGQMEDARGPESQVVRASGWSTCQSPDTQTVCIYAPSSCDAD